MNLKSALFLISMLTMTSLFAQSTGKREKWIGINNLAFKNHATKSLTPLPSDPSAMFDKGEINRQFSFGIYYRIIHENKPYQQFDLLAIGWAKDETYGNIIKDNQLQPVNGAVVNTLNLLIGYQRGKLHPITSKLNGDIGIRGNVWYQNIKETPTTGFNSKSKSIGLAFDLKVGLNYQIFKKINIGYNIIPASSNFCWTQELTNNPFLPEPQRTHSAINIDLFLFKSILSTSNISISYVF